MFNNIKHKQIIGNLSQYITTQSLEQWLPTAETSHYQLKTGNSVFTLLITRQASNYQYILFDANSSELILIGQNKQNIITALCQGLTDYLRVELPNNFIIANKITRAAEIGIEKTTVGQFKFDIYRLNLEHDLKTEISSLITLLPDKSEARA